MKRLVIFAVAAMMALVGGRPRLGGRKRFDLHLRDGRSYADRHWLVVSKSEELTTQPEQATVGTWFVNMPGHSYLRARFYSVDKNVGGRIELGLSSPATAGRCHHQPALCVRLLARGQLAASWPARPTTGSAPWPTTCKQYVGLNESAHLLMFGWGFLWPRSCAPGAVHLQHRLSGACSSPWKQPSSKRPTPSGRRHGHSVPPPRTSTIRCPA